MSSPLYVTSPDGGLTTSRNQENIAALASQLKKIQVGHCMLLHTRIGFNALLSSQAELDELKSRSMFSPAQPPRPNMSPLSNTMYSPRQPHLSPMGQSPVQLSPSQGVAIIPPSTVLSQGVQPFHIGASPGSHSRSPLAVQGQTQYMFQSPGQTFAPQPPFSASPQTGSPGLSLPPHLQSHSFMPRGSGDLGQRPPLFGTVQSAIPSQLPVASTGLSMPPHREQAVKPFSVGLPTTTLAFTPLQTHPSTSQLPVNFGIEQKKTPLFTTKATTTALPPKTSSIPEFSFAAKPEILTSFSKAGTISQSFPKTTFSPKKFKFGQSEPSSTQSSGLASGFNFNFSGSGVSQVPKPIFSGISQQSSADTKPSSIPTTTDPVSTSVPVFTHQAAVSSESQQLPLVLSGSGTSFNFTGTTASMLFSSKANEPPKTTAGLGESFPILSSLLSSSQPKGIPVTKEDTVSANLSSIGSAIFSAPANQDEHNQDHNESLDNSDRGPDFTPLVSLPEVDNLQTGEENEYILFVHKAKLYRFDKEWKEKGVGEMKILKHRSSGKVRLLMRRDQIKKLCCNHYIVPGMSLQYGKGSNRMLCWFTNTDFSDGEAKAEKLGIKFKSEESAAKFKETFEYVLSEQGESDNSNNESNYSAQTNESTLDHSNQSSSVIEQSSIAVSPVPDEKILASDLHSRFAPPAGSWSCDVCMINNDKSATQCVACSAKKPGSSVSAASGVKQPAVFTSNIQSRFAPPAGSWSCDVCMVSNDKSASQCVACSAKKPGSSPINSGVAPVSTSFNGGGFKIGLTPLFASGTSTSTAPTECSTLSSQTDSISSNPALLTSFVSSSSVSSGGGFNLGKFSLLTTASSSSTYSEGGFKIQPPSTTATGTTHTGGLKLTPSQTFTLSTTTCTTTSASARGFDLEPAAITSTHPEGSSKFNLPSFPPSTTSLSTTPAGSFKFSFTSGASITAPASTGAASVGFKFGQISLSTTATTTTTSTVPSTDLKLGFEPPHSVAASTLSPREGLSAPSTMPITATSTGSLINSLPGFGFGTASTEGFKFDSAPFATSTASKPEHEDEDQPDVYFKPLVTLPDSAELHTGEEGTEVLFTHQAKLYRFDSVMSQWKERGTGDIKLLKYPDKDKVRIVMRREQVKKICCNHYLTPTMSLSPMSNSDKAWTWYTLNDYVDGVSKPEKLAVRFKSAETAQHFKHVFDAAVSRLATEADSEEDSTSDTSVSEKDLTGERVPSEVDLTHDKGEEISDTEVIVVSEDMPSPEKIALAKRFQLPVTFFNYEKKQPCSGCRGCIDESIDLPREENEISQDQSTGLLGQDNPQESATSKFSFGGGGEITSFSDLASSKGSFWFDSKSQSKLSGFTRAGEVLFGSKVTDNGDPEAETEIHFKPLVSLPDVELKTGEECDETLFSHRAKLFRFDPTVKQWKERGIGDIKITKNINTNKFRVIMRRDQIRKLCCNHYITPAINLTPNQGSDRSWVWYTSCDFSEGEQRPEKLAVRFKSSDTAAAFKRVFDSVQTGNFQRHCIGL